METSTCFFEKRKVELQRRKKIEGWLLRNKEFLKYQPIEEKLELTRGTLQKFLKYGRKMNDEVITKFEKFIEDFCKK